MGVLGWGVVFKALEEVVKPEPPSHVAAPHDSASRRQRFQEILGSFFFLLGRESGVEARTIRHPS